MPSSKVYVGHVPFDSTYKHVIRFSSREEQASQMLAHMSAPYSGNDFTFIRDGATIRIEANADSLNGFNYCMYNNGNKWYYNFIDRIVYVNDITTELYITRDVMQTWMFDYDRTACFVEREHVNDDSRYRHTVPEPNMPVEYTYDNYSDHKFAAPWLLIMTTEFPHWLNQQIAPLSADAVSGGVYHKQYSAAKFLLFDINTASGKKAAKEFTKQINAVGAAEAIVGVFLVPGEVIGSAYEPLSYDGQGYIPNGVYQMKENVNLTVEDAPTIVVPAPTDMAGYVPRNNKLLSYPFTYMEVGDYTGRTVDMQFELSNAGNHSITLRELMPVCASMQLLLRPEDYNNSNDVVMAIDIAMKLPWTYDTFSNWSAQHGLSNALSIVGGVVTGAMAVGGALTGVGAVAGVIGAGAFNDVVNTGANIAQMAMQPNQARGNVNGDVRIGSDTWGFFTRYRVLRPEYAKIWDDFFDMFGYEVDEIKVPNETGRPSWNYVRTKNCPYNGNVNSHDMAMINQCYDAGVTFWHTWDVGNYALGNS